MSQYLWTRDTMPTMPPPSNYEDIVELSRPMVAPLGACEACDGLGVVFTDGCDEECACSYASAAE